MDPRETRRLGRTTVRVSRLGVGMAPMIGADGHVDDRTAEAIVREAVRSGLRYIDVSPLYGLGRSEAAVRRAMATVGPDALTVSTKAGRLLRRRTLRSRLLVRVREIRYAPSAWATVRGYARIVLERVRRSASAAADEATDQALFAAASAPQAVVIHDFSPRGLLRSARESLARLGRNDVEILFLHDPDGLSDDELLTAWAALERIRVGGRARAIGISSNDAVSLTRMLELVDPDVVLLAGRYTLLDQGAMDDLLPAAQDRGVAVILGGVFHGGIVADPGTRDRFDYHPATALERRRVERLGAIAANHDVVPAAAAIQFAAAHPAVAAVVVGAASPAELAEDVRLAETPIPPRFWEELVRAQLVRPDAPVPVAELAEAVGAAS